MTAPPDELTASVLIPSWRRPEQLGACLKALSEQTRKPAQVIVVWQEGDVATRDALFAAQAGLGLSLVVLHSPVAGVVAAENIALEAATSDIVLLIDDDAIAEPDWIERHLAHYRDPRVGAVGGPAVNYMPDGSTLPINGRTPVGKLAWFGRAYGNMHDQPAEWRAKLPFSVDHLVGYNMSLRRGTFTRFESALRKYWQQFELDVCLHIRARGYKILFDPGIVVAHYPTNVFYVEGRAGDLEIKVDNAAYNEAFVLSKHSPSWLFLPRLLINVVVGVPAMPGPLLWPICVRRYGDAAREVSVAARSVRAKLEGWRDGLRARARRGY